MSVIPIGREDASLQRRPWITFALIALNVVAYIVFCSGSSAREEDRVIRSWREVIAFLRDRPYLRVPPQIAELMPAEIRQRTPRPDPSVPDWRVAKEDDQLAEMANDFRREYDAAPEVRYAWVPAVGSAPTIVTSMFLHAGLLHLIGNMLFLFAMAPFVEDLFGPILFPVLYLSGGVVATMAYGWRHPDSVIPLVGASGAIAAVLGAFLVCFARARLRFLLFPLMIRFTLPAMVVLPFWFLEQLVSIPAEEGSGVAVTAHVGGFVYGLAFAAIFRVARRAATPRAAIATKTKTAPAIPRAVLAARDALRRGDVDEALRSANQLLADDPKELHAVRLLLDVELARQNNARVDALATRLLEAYGAAGDRLAARALIDELRSHPAAHQFLSRAAALLERWGDRKGAIDLLDGLAEAESGTPNALTTLLRLAALRRGSGDREGAMETLQRALAQPACSPEWRRRIDTAIASL